MVRYDAPLRDYTFLLHEVFEVVELAEQLGYVFFFKQKTAYEIFT